MVKRLPTMWETWVRSLGWEDPLEKEMATHSSILAWKIPWTEEPSRYRPWGRKESDMTEQVHFTSYLLINSFPRCPSDFVKPTSTEHLLSQIECFLTFSANPHT